ncbi:chorion class CA protein ERA.1-like [Battus philenor]|uniref:chorion class CA protein ERA.1-like n=1 Tax=Battus philenor TaxID=42288 RepID=UPI0035D0F2B5
MSSLAFLLLCAQSCLIQITCGQYLGAGPGLGYAPAVVAENELGCGAELPFGPSIAPGLPGPGYGYGLMGPAAFAGPVGYGAPAGYAAGPAYGGAGIGDVEVAGEMPVAGTTVVAGQVPILGAVQFTGEVPAGGVVSIVGRCGCGCGGPYMY